MKKIILSFLTEIQTSQKQIAVWLITSLPNRYLLSALYPISNPIQTNRMFLGTDPVQIDAYGCQLMGLKLEDVPYISQAEHWGAGSTEVGDIIALNAPQEKAAYPRASGIVKQLTRNVTADSACSALIIKLPPYRFPGYDA